MWKEKWPAFTDVYDMKRGKSEGNVRVSSTNPVLAYLRVWKMEPIMVTGNAEGKTGFADVVRWRREDHVCCFSYDELE